MNSTILVGRVSKVRADLGSDAPWERGPVFLDRGR